MTYEPNEKNLKAVEKRTYIQKLILYLKDTELFTEISSTEFSFDPIKYYNVRYDSPFLSFGTARHLASVISNYNGVKEAALSTDDLGRLEIIVLLEKPHTLILKGVNE